MFTYIDTKEDLAFLNTELLHKPFLGVDTEFRRTNKDNMRLALIQINDDEEIYLIDAVSIIDPGDDCSFLFSESVVKVLHSCKEDLEAIFAWTGKIISNLFDTQLANAFLDGEYSIGYQGLVENKLDIKLDKKETRSNWIRRPLSDSQLNYAASDVEFLINLYLEQEKELIKYNKMDWLKEELTFLCSTTFGALNCDEKISNSLTRQEEKELLSRFNESVKQISREEKINTTLFFSKKSQKDFIRIAFNQGIDTALESVTIWRKDLIQESLGELLSNK